MNERGIVSIKILGGFLIQDGDEEIVGFERPRLQRLLVFLLLNRGQAVARSHLAFTFWTDSNETQALANLRNLWYKLRQVLPDSHKFITADRASVKWYKDAPYVLDAVEFENYIAQANNAIYHAEKIDLLEKAVKTYGGELLPGYYDDWLLAERKRCAVPLWFWVNGVNVLNKRGCGQSRPLFVRLARSAGWRAKIPFGDGNLHEACFAK